MLDHASDLDYHGIIGATSEQTKLRHRNRVAAFEVIMTEEERVELYHQLLESGLSDYEARGTAWPEEE